MDMADLMALMGLEFLYDALEERYGRLVASIVTLALALVIFGAVVWLLTKVLGH
jgi:hypothetical protein